jgi:quinolinate synthase
MAMNGLAGLVDCLETGRGEIVVEEAVRVKALRCIDRMLDFVKRHPGAIAQPRAGFVPHVGSA